MPERSLLGALLGLGLMGGAGGLQMQGSGRGALRGGVVGGGPPCPVVGPPDPHVSAPAVGARGASAVSGR